MSKVILTRVVLVIQIIVLCLLLYNSYRANYQLKSPFIPQTIKASVQQSMVFTLGVSLAGLITAATAHYFSKNTASICISIIFIIYMFFPGLLPLVPTGI
jgi:uncharacterized membrane protein